MQISVRKETLIWAIHFNSNRFEKYLMGSIQEDCFKQTSEKTEGQSSMDNPETQATFGYWTLNEGKQNEVYNTKNQEDEQHRQYIQGVNLDALER